MRARFDTAAIVAATGGKPIGAGGAGPVTANSQTLAAGEWFVALAGPGFDDHAFVPEAAARGAAGVIVERAPDVDVPAVVVADTWHALGHLGNAARHRFGGSVIGVTGSCGKTTTRALVALALSPMGPVHQTPANTNNRVGVPLAILEGPMEARAAVLELGSFQPGEIAYLAGIVEPDVRLVTNAGPAHLEGLGTVDGVAVEKGALYDGARPGDICIVNADDARMARWPLPPGARRVTFGAGGHVELIDAVLDAATLTTLARWRTPRGEVCARVPSPGAFVARNAAAALAVAWSLGVDLHHAAQAMEGYQPIGRRLLRRTVAPGATLFDDTFNANPVSMAAALRTLASLPGRRAAVLGDMHELGDQEGRYHEQTVALAADIGLDLLILVGPRMVAAAEAAPGALVFGDAPQAIEPLRNWLRSGDHVLLKGSHGAGVVRVATALTEA